MKHKDKQEMSDSELDRYGSVKPKEEWIETNSTSGTEPGMEPGSDEKPREVWVDKNDE